jgi:hypothetical protein
MGGEFQLMSVGANGTGAALGSGFASFGHSTVESLTIEGGVFACWANVTSTYRGAGIGAGPTRSSSSSIGPITIRNATIRAAGATGIGTGTGESGSSVAGAITIESGDYVLRGDVAAGLGTGRAIYGSSTVHSITVVDARVNATGTYGAGVGAGYGDTSGTAHIGSLEIHGSSVTAMGHFSAGVGCGYAYDGTSSIDSLTIANSVVNASVEVYGAGIGGGSGAHNGGSLVGSLTIVNSSITAVGKQAAAIGAGTGYLSNSTIGEIELVGGTYFLRSTWRSGVGSGDALGGTSHANTVSITGGRFAIDARGGFGSTDRADTAQLSLAGEVEVDCTVLLEYCIDAQHITGSGLVLHARTNAARLANAKIYGPAALDVQFSGASDNSGMALPLLHFGQLQLPHDAVHVWAVADGWESRVPFESGAFGVMFSVPANSRVRLSVNNSANTVSELCHDRFQNDFNVAETEVFFDLVTVCEPEPSGLSVSAKVGIAVGVGGAAVIIAIVAVLVWRKRKANNEPAPKYTLNQEDGQLGQPSEGPAKGPLHYNVF